MQNRANVCGRKTATTRAHSGGGGGDRRDGEVRTFPPPTVRRVLWGTMARARVCVCVYVCIEKQQRVQDALATLSRLLRSAWPSGAAVAAAFRTAMAKTRARAVEQSPRSRERRLAVDALCVVKARRAVNCERANAAAVCFLTPLARFCNQAARRTKIFTAF